MGHALNNTLQDILCRFERMRGKDVLWQPGTDHAGIATQAVVERQLMERQQPGSRELGREAFIERVWEWKAESGGAIIGQLKRLGASCDWSRERFTMDEGLSRAVAKVFVELYRDGLIYKDKRLVNWDPKLKTAISDLEVQQVEVKGHLWHIKYPIEGSDEFIVVATTRPETMLGDTAVAVHPENERYKHLIGKTAILPLVGRRIPIIGDDYADPEKGTGAVKITPAHDFNDFEVGRRHDLPLVNVLDAEGAARSAGQRGVSCTACRCRRSLTRRLSLHGLDRFAARKRIVEHLEARGLLDKIEPTTHTVPHGDRSGAVVEPYPHRPMVRRRQDAGAAGDRGGARRRKTVFVPGAMGSDLLQLDGEHPALVHFAPDLVGASNSRPGMGPDGKVFVAENEDDAVADALAHYTDIEEITVEEGHDIAADPERQRAVCQRISASRRGRARHLVLVGAVAVLDARLARRDAGAETLLPDQRARHRLRHHLLLGRAHDDDGAALHEGSAVPRPSTSTRWCATSAGRRCRSRKATSSTRSKSSTSTAPMRCASRLPPMAAQGRDIKLSAQRVEGYRNFATKLWNAARFAEMNGCVRDPDFDAARREGGAQPLDRARDREGGQRGHCSDRGLQIQRGGGGDLSLRLEYLLRLVSGAGKAGAHRRGRRRQGRNARDHGLGARRDRQVAASVHAVHH